jgi:hypothetical protein
MQLTTRFLEAVALAEDRSSSPVTFMWPMPGHAGGQLRSLSAFADWRAFALDLGLRRGVPDIVAAKFARGQKLLLLAWIDFDLFMAGELIALTALELALKDRYGDGEIERRRKIVAEKAKKGKREVTKEERSWADKTPFADLLKYMVEQDSLTDAISNPWLDKDMQPLALTEPEIDDVVAFFASLTSPQYKELGDKEYARQFALSKVSRTQRDTQRAFGPKPKQPPPPPL